MKHEPDSSLPASVWLQIDSLCDRFEQDRQQGNAKEVSYYLNQIASEYRGILRRELAQVEQEIAREPKDHQADQRTLGNAEWTIGRTMGHLAAGEKVGPFRLIEKLGRGSFGEVWQAEDERLHRIVALKLAHSIRPEHRDLFLREAKAAASLQHPGIVRILEIGEWDGELCIVRQFVEGPSLAEVLRSETIDVDRACRIALEVAHALAYSHEHQCIHRDLKPQNILIDQATGKPLLIDFGLAKHSNLEGSITQSGQILGTPCYMSPEQACGQGNRVDGRTDIWSLGIILYQMVVGETPFRGSFEMILKQVLEDDPPDPRRQRKEISSDLSTIILKCLEKDASRRYATASLLAEDLQRLLTGWPIVARPITSMEKTWRWCCRFPVVATLLCIVVALVLGMTGGSIFVAARMTDFWKKEVELRRIAEQEAARAKAEQTTTAEVIRFLENVFVAADPVTLNWFVDDITKQDLDADELLDRASKRIRSELANQPHIQARMMDTMANVYRSLGALDSAQKLLDDAEKIRESTRSERDPKEISRETTTHDFYRACLLQARGEQAGARLLLQTVMENRVRLDGPEARSVADTWFQIGWLHLEEQRSSEAEQAFSKALQIRKKHLPADHPELVMTELALTQSQLRSNDSLLRALVLANTLTSSQAGQLVRDAIELQLARSQKDFEKAIAKYRSILASMETLLNPQDPRLLLAKGDLASLLWDAGHYEEAFQLIMPALEAGRKIAPKHPKLRRALVHVAQELLLCCRFEESESLFREALPIPSASLSDDAELIQGLVSLLLATGRKDEAKNVLDNFSAKDKLDIVPQIWLGYLRLLSLRDADEIEKTKEKLLESLEQVTVTHLRSHWQSRMAIVWHRLGRNKESLYGHLAALQSEESLRPPMHPRIADHLMALAVVYEEQGEDFKALEYVKRSYEIRKTSLPTVDPRTAQSRELIEKLEQRARGE